MDCCEGITSPKYEHRGQPKAGHCGFPTRTDWPQFLFFVTLINTQTIYQNPGLNCRRGCKISKWSLRKQLPRRFSAQTTVLHTEGTGAPRQDLIWPRFRWIWGYQDFQGKANPQCQAHSKNLIRLFTNRSTDSLFWKWFYFTEVK